jgi:ABC-2 type transport system permease protein
MGRITGTQLARGLVIQALWVFAAYLIARFAWNRGIRKYSAVGG